MRTVKTISIIICMIIAVLSATSLYATEYLIGIKAWYANWEPGIKGIGDKFNDTGFQHLETGSGWMYGPNMSILITDNLSISISYLYGNLYSKFDKAWGFTSILGEDMREDLSGNVTTERQDLDCALSYRMTPLLRIFAGY
jgi:hypothetical protein